VSFGPKQAIRPAGTVRFQYPPGMKPTNWETAMAVVGRLDYHHRRGAIGSFHWRDIARIFKKQDGLCAYCDKPFPRKRGTKLRGVQAFLFEIEHRTPVCRGGSNFTYNLCLACRKCNKAKGAMTEPEFRKSLEPLSDEAARRMGGGDTDVAHPALKPGPTELELTA
jgi:5-methylcytosine-specific restriction endonuclease McrA